MNKLMIQSALLFGAVCAQPAAAEEDSRSWYAGAGLGISRLVPDTGSTPYGVDDSRSTGGKLFAGLDLSSAAAVEAYYSDLGKAKMSPSGTIGYTDLGATLLYYFFQQDERREGWSGFLRLGLGKMENSTGLNYKRVHDEHFVVGLGAERGLGNGYAVRADLDLYDKDAQFFTLNLVKRFGGAKERPAPQVAAPVPPPAAPVAVAVDSDGDGVLDHVDACPGTASGVRVDEKGCPLESVIVLQGVSFATNSARLESASAPALDGVVATLVRYPEMRVEIAGHTDNSGSVKKNKQLSQRRAESVRDYLAKHGIAVDRLTARGYGPEQPVADNRTADGRALNRRVELHVLK